MCFDEQVLAHEQIRASGRTAADVAREVSTQDAEPSVQPGFSREAPTLTPANVTAMQRVAGNHALARLIAGQAAATRVTAGTSSSISGSRRLQRMRISSAVLNGNFVGLSQNNPGPDATLEYKDRTYGYHYHANGYREGDLQSITLTIWSATSGRRQHMTATENRHGEWQYNGSGDRIMPDADAESKLANKIRLLGEAQSRVRDISSTDALDMPLGALIANSEGRGW
jgi:hypothetical protein